MDKQLGDADVKELQLSEKYPSATMCSNMQSPELRTKIHKCAVLLYECLILKARCGKLLCSKKKLKHSKNTVLHFGT